MPFFSIVIPVYNAETYLKKCTDSIRKQSFADYEVLLVDDASEDSSADISQEICRQDQRFHYYPKTHAGAAAARNYGIACSKGEYIVFVDSDDYVEKLLLEKLADTILEGERPELCFMNSHYVVENSQKKKIEVFQLPVVREKPGIFTGPEFLELVTRPGSHIPGSTWLITLQREFLQRFDLKFNEELIWSEDSDFSYQAIVYAQKIKCCDYCGYDYYIENTGSVSKKFSFDKAVGRMDVYIKWCRYFMEDKAAVQKFSKYCREQLIQQFLSEYCATLNTCIESKEPFNRKLLYAKAKDDYFLWKRCQNLQYREYVRFGAKLGGLYRKLKRKIKYFIYQ